MGASIVEQDYIGNYSDKIWTCYCGAWNAHYRDTCGACGKLKSDNNNINN